MPFDADLHAKRRARLMKRLRPRNAVVVLAAAPEIFRNSDVPIRYRQNSTFQYFTGLEESDVVALVSPDEYVLCLRPVDPKTTTWTGETTGLDRAVSVYGADRALPLAEAQGELRRMAAGREAVFAPFDLPPAFLHEILDGLRPRSSRSTAQPPAALVDCRPQIEEMRLRKEPGEIERLREAALITTEALREVLPTIAPGRHEYEIEAALEARFRQLGAERWSFATIVASGPNAAILHYVKNERQIEKGDLVLLDSGAEYDYYPADFSRTVPASGRFSKAQAEIYAIVLEAQKAALDACRPGTTLAAVHAASMERLCEGLVRLKILSGKVEDLLETAAWRPYCPHGTSHWIGLDVHDVGSYVVDGKQRPLEPGMVFSVEPGLYFPPGLKGVPARYRGIGVRIEDDVIITRKGKEVLGLGVPKEIDAVEAMMAGEL